MARLRVLTWNINGLRRVVAAFGSLQRLLEALQPADVICFQETKLTRGDLRRELALVDGWESFFAFTRGKVGYSGVVTFCRRDRTVPLHAEEGFTGVLELPPGSRLSGAGPSAAAAALHPRWHAAGWSVEELRNLDCEGRVVITDHGAFVLVNVYGPAITSEERAEERMSYKMDFYRALQLRLDGFLSEGRRVVLLGDLNIAPDVIDVCGATPRDFDARRADRAWLQGLLSRGRSSNSGSSSRVRERGAAAAAAAAAGCGRGNGGNVGEDEEVEVDLEEDGAGCEQCSRSGGFGGSGSGGVGLPPFVDTFRAFHPRRQHAYTCWNTSSGARVNNYGSRIDHVLVADGSGSNSSSNRGCGNGAGGGGYMAAEHTGAAAACGCLAWVVAADIMPDMDGSDHAPARVELELQDDQLTRGSAAGGPPPPLSSRGLFDASRQATLHAVLSRRPQAATAPTLADSVPPAAASSAPLCGGSSVATAGAAAAGLHRSASCSAAQMQKAGGGCGGGGGRKGGSGISAAGGASQKKLTAFLRPKAPLAIEGAAKSGIPPGGGGGGGGGANGGEDSSMPEAPYDDLGVTNGGAESRSVGHDQQGTASQQSPQPHRYQAELHPQSHHHQHHQHRHGALQQPQEPWQRREQGQQPKGLKEWAQPGSPACGWSAPTADIAGMATECGNNGGGVLCQAAPDFPPDTSNSGPLETAGFRPLGPPAHMSSGGGAPADYQPLLYGEYDVMARHDDRQGQQGPAGQQSRGLWTAAGAQDEVLAVTEQAKAKAAAEASEALPAAGRSQAALAWRQIQDQMKPPRCSGHGEPCVVRTVKKRGENNGRQFWCCARPDGLRPNGRCDFFQWARGRNSAGAAAGSGAGGSAAADAGPAGGCGPGGAKGPAAGARQQQHGSSGAGRGGGSGGGGGRAAMSSNMPRKKPRT